MNKNKLIGFILLFVISLCAQAQSNDLNKFLNVDRFQAYLQRWSITMENRGQGEIAKIIRALEPEEILKLNLPNTKLADAFHYDDLILQILKKTHPQLIVAKADVAWEYNFYKRKLNEAYLVGEAKITEPVKAPIVELGADGKPLKLSKLAQEDILLNVEGYVTGRSTRGIYWDASKNKRQIELHVGSAGDFKADLAERGGKILGQVRTLERNYNPIYLVQFPGEKEYRYAVTEISGADRLKHFVMQSQLITWNDGNLPIVSVYGDPALHLASEEAALKGVLENLPKADRVVIGQKGAFERSFSSMGKAEAVLDFAKKHPKVVLAKIEGSGDRNLINFLKKGIENPAAFRMQNLNNFNSLIDDVYEELEELFPKYKIPEPVNFTVYNLDRGSYEVSDYMLKGKDGKIQRWRIFSNSWGDEVLPIARALKASGHTEVVYIGTAGALPEANINVGDIVIPEHAIDSQGNKYKVKLDGNIDPVGSKHSVNAVINVATPFEETHDWLGRAKKTSQVVEIETGHLAATFNGRADKFTPILLVSDVVGVEGKTLAEASSTQRVDAQTRAMAAIFDDAGIVSPVAANVNGNNKLGQWLDELVPNRDPASRFQVLQVAQDQGIATKADLKKLLTSESGFSTNRLTTVLNESGTRLEAFLGELDGRPKFSISREFLEGRWNPSKSPIEIHLQVATKKAELELNQALTKFLTDDKEFKKLLDIKVSRTAADNNFIKLQRIPEAVSETLLELYKDSALGFGGLASTETRSGSLKFVQVGEGTAGRAQATIAYFAPDKVTAEILEELDGRGTEAVLTREVAAMNKFAGPNDPWEIKVTVVDELVGGNLAQIVPDLGGKADNLTIHLRITKAGLKNPAVVMEELIHLQQITGAPLPWKPKSQMKAFVHPYHWAEVVANSRAGSIQASEKLARLELEAARASEDAVRFYKKNGLFSGIDANMIDQYLEARAAHAEDLYSDIAKAARKDIKEKNAAWQRAKKVFDQLESQSTKLNDYVAKGDRKGARNLIEKYLPWDLMEPSEKKSWNDWLEAMEKPNKKNTRLVFRGMYDDTVMKAADGTPYLMSTVMTRNQGSYTRRLRSLSTMREKFGSEALRDNYSVYNLERSKNPGSISVMMANHAIEAKGSPFLSTASYDVATKFGPRQLGAFEIDERRLILNAMSPDKYLYQHEMLTPLIIFPDEVVHFHDYARNPVEGVGPRSPEVRRKHFVGELENKIGRKVTEAEMSGKGSDKQFLNRSYKALQEMVMEKENLPKASPGCLMDSKACDCLFGTLNSLLK